jgi:hypothetical protein
MITIVRGVILLLFFLASVIRILKETGGNRVHTAWAKNQRQKGGGNDTRY